MSTEPGGNAVLRAQPVSFFPLSVLPQILYDGWLTLRIPVSVFPLWHNSGSSCFDGD